VRRAADLDVLGEVDLAHAAFADELDDAVATVDVRADIELERLGIGLLRERRGRNRIHRHTRDAAIALARRSFGSSRHDRSRARRRSRACARWIIAGIGYIGEVVPVALLDHLRSSSVAAASARGCDARHHLLALDALADDIVGEQLLQELRHARAVGVGALVASHCWSAMRMSSQSL